MGSRKGSAKARQRAEFDTQLGGQLAGLSDAFARESERREQNALAKEEALRERACESKNRYQSRADAEEAIRSCAEHGTRGLRCYRCEYCRGWHLTSHGTRE